MQLTCRDRVERAARIYTSNKEASRALGIAAGSFGRLCLRYGIENTACQAPPAAAGSENGKPCRRMIRGTRRCF